MKCSISSTTPRAWYELTLEGYKSVLQVSFQLHLGIILIIYPKYHKYNKYNRYSFLNSVMDRYVFPYSAGPVKFMRLLWYAPLMYWDYYLIGKHSNLPPTRNMCLLESGVAAAKREVEYIKGRMQDEEELRQAMLQVSWYFT